MLYTNDRRSRTSHEFLTQLIAWASDGHDRTLNQNFKPALIIVLNKDTTPGYSSNAIESSTNQLLRSFERTSEYEKLRSEWRARGRKIRNARDLLLCYYDDFSVIAIPSYAVYNPPAITALVSSRIKSLYEEIHLVSTRMRERRADISVGFDIATLNKYLETSLRVLGRDYRSSLDFHSLTEGDTPIPITFGDHTAELMHSLAKTRVNKDIQQVPGEQQVVDDIADYVASCIVAQIPTELDKGMFHKNTMSPTTEN